MKNIVKNVLVGISLIFIFTSCFKKEEAPKDWLDWVKSSQERFNEKISVPSTLQHLYITLGEGEFYLSQGQEGEAAYKLVKFSSYDSDKKFVIDFDKESILSGGEFVGDTKNPITINERISLKIVFYKEEASSKARIFLYDQKIKDLDKKRKRHYFDYSSKFIKTAVYKKLEKPETKKFGRSDGTTRDFNKVGDLVFKDSNDSLSIYSEPGDEENKKNMLMFKDKTSGVESYGAGRYVVIDLPKVPSQLNDGDEVLVDFNYTFNPPCAVSKGFHCPLAQDVLSFKVKAGERYKL